MKKVASLLLVITALIPLTFKAARGFHDTANLRSHPNYHLGKWGACWQVIELCNQADFDSVTNSPFADDKPKSYTTACCFHEVVKELPDRLEVRLGASQFEIMLP